MQSCVSLILPVCTNHHPESCPHYFAKHFQSCTFSTCILKMYVFLFPCFTRRKDLVYMLFDLLFPCKHLTATVHPYSGVLRGITHVVILPQFVHPASGTCALGPWQVLLFEQCYRPHPLHASCRAWSENISCLSGVLSLMR